MPTTTEHHVVLAALSDGEHVQVGAPAEWSACHVLWTLLDGSLRGPNGRGERLHSIHGAPVRFYRMRSTSDDVAAEFGDVRQVGLNHVRRDI